MCLPLNFTPTRGSRGVLISGARASPASAGRSFSRAHRATPKCSERYRERSAATAPDWLAMRSGILPAREPVDSAAIQRTRGPTGALGFLSRGCACESPLAGYEGARVCETGAVTRCTVRATHKRDAMPTRRPGPTGACCTYAQSAPVTPDQAFLGAPDSESCVTARRRSARRLCAFVLNRSCS